MVDSKSYIVKAFWDAEAKVWVAESDDIPGLATEAKDIDALIKKLDIMVPELLEMNGMLRSHPENEVIPYQFCLDRQTTISAAV